MATVLEETTPLYRLGLEDINGLPNESIVDDQTFIVYPSLEALAAAEQAENDAEGGRFIKDLFAIEAETGEPLVKQTLFGKAR